MGATPSRQEIEAHRNFTLPTIRYPAGQKPSRWGSFPLRLLVNESGRVQCYDLVPGTDGPPILDAQREDAIRQLPTWQYRAFLRDGMPALAVVDEDLYEERMPAEHRPLPDVPLDKVKISLSRGSCGFACDVYKVEIRGDGRVTYEEDGRVVLRGRYEYRIPVEDVRALVEKVRNADIWSMESDYDGDASDASAYRLDLEMGATKKTIHNLMGEWVGMPRAVTEIEDEVDRISRAKEMRKLTPFLVENLERDGFDFTSQAVADLLFQGVVDVSADERALQRLVELGAPLRNQTQRAQFWPGYDFNELGLLELALSHRRYRLADMLMERGVLLTGGRPDRAKLDRAFLAAIEGGRLSAVQSLWEKYPSLKPSLQYRDKVIGRPDSEARTMPVVLRLRPMESRRDEDWQGKEIAQWLASKGNDLHAHALDGSTLLHTAARATDFAFVRYLLDQGLDPNDRGARAPSIISVAQDQEIVLLFLNAGVDSESNGGYLRQDARRKNWGRVLDWLARQDAMRNAQRSSRAHQGANATVH